MSDRVEISVWHIFLVKKATVCEVFEMKYADVEFMWCTSKNYTHSAGKCYNRHKVGTGTSLGGIDANYK